MAELQRKSQRTNLPIERELEEQKVLLIRTLLHSLSAETRAALLKEFAAEAADTSGSPTGVLATVIRLFPPNHPVTVAELRRAVEDHGLDAEPKEIYNAISYLSRTGALKRTGYGRYRTSDGMEISTTDDFGGELHRYEGLSDD
jgi:hypothetical protein